MLARSIITDPWGRIQVSNKQILTYDRGLAKLVREDPVAKRLMTIPEVGEQVATGVVASVPDPAYSKTVDSSALG